jgi:hypothetical protein
LVLDHLAGKLSIFAGKVRLMAGKLVNLAGKSPISAGKLFSVTNLKIRYHFLSFIPMQSLLDEQDDYLSQATAWLFQLKCL